MKHTIYIITLLILSTNVFSAAWGSVDFRILEHDTPLEMPIVLEFENYEGKDLEAELLIFTIGPHGSYGISDYEESFIIPKDPELKKVLLEVTKEEEFYDVYVMVFVNDIVSQKIYNSLIRFTQEPTDNLPPLPGQQLRQEVSQVLEEHGQEVNPNEKPSPKEHNYANYIAIGVAILLFIAILWIVYVFYYKNSMR